MTNYQSFIGGKLLAVPPSGFAFDGELVGSLFPHQIDLTRWALRRGRAAIFADTGLGKMRMEIAWAHQVHAHTGKPVVILAPLAVAQQIVREAAGYGVHINHLLAAGDEIKALNVVNYERIHLFDSQQFGAVVLDESSVIKHHSSKTLQQLLDAFRYTPYKLCATATPSPNDWTELGTHAEFLGVCTRPEMLAEFFVHDGGDTQSWRLKGHARHVFWRWVSSWGVMLRSPADLGYDASAYTFPPPLITQHTVETEHDQEATGQLFMTEATDLMSRRNARKESLAGRVLACADVVNGNEEAWVIWCELNAEGEALRKAIPDAVEVSGADSLESKEKKLLDFEAGRIRVLISKPSICGFGLNWQHCARMAFVGVTDSWESYYQALRRILRFGQKRQVEVHVFASDKEGSVVANLTSKEAAAKEMAEAMSLEVYEAVRSEVQSTRQSNPYHPKQAMNLPSFLRQA